MRGSILLLFLLSFVLNINAQVSPCQEEVSTAHFSLNQCVASQSYEEFTADILDNQECNPISIVGGNLYRDNPTFNMHSCTPGVSSLGMCVSIDDNCTFDPTSDKAIKVDVLISPEGGSSASLSGLTFFEKSNPFYLWQFGQTGDNNYPTKYSVTVKVGGATIYSQTDIGTNIDWTEQFFDFSSNPSFTVNTPTEFNIELLAYCPVGNGATIAVWDIDELSIDASCSSTPEGGTLTGGPFEFCVNDGESDFIDSTALVISGNTGASSQWVITDISGNILGLPDHYSDVDFDGAPAGSCLVWHLSYEGTIEGLEVGNDASDLMGCFALSNSVEVIRTSLSGGTLLGGPFVFCVGDGVSDFIGTDQITLSGNTGPNSQWVITDDQGNILGIPPSFTDVDFDGAGLGTCLIWHLSFADGLEGAAVGNNASQLEGCFSLSNPIEVQRGGPQGGVLEGGPYTFCVGDGFADIINPGDISLTGNTGSFSQWVITDDQGNILGLPPFLSDVNFDDAEIGTCLVWHLSFEDGLMGAEVGNNASQLEGCFNLSNSLEVNRTETQAAVLEGGPFVFCVGDGESDFIDSLAITVNGGQGSNTQWVVTNQQGDILGLPPHYSMVDFDGAGDGICLVWLVHYEGVLNGAVVGNNASLLSGCFSLSNAIPVVRNGTSGGIIEGGPFFFCVGDGGADIIDSTEIILTDNVGTNSQWVVTDDQGNILGLPGSISDVDFDGAGEGTCLIWHLSFENGLQGAMVGNNASELEGCFSLSNSIEVIRTGPVGGVLEGGPFLFCIGDDEDDFIASSEITLSGNVGTFSQWVITDELGNILGLPGSFSDVNFEDAGEGTCLIWHMSLEDGLMGAAVGNNASDLEGCFSLSNPIEVVRSSDPSACGNLMCPEEEEMTLFGLIDKNLITMSQSSGVLQSIIPINTDLEDFSSITWHEIEDVFYAVAERNSTPTLVTIDRYTGSVIEVGVLFPASSTIPDFTICEGLEYNNDDGKMYASAGNNPANSNFFSFTLFEVNTGTAECTLIGNISGSCQDEADFMAFANGEMYYIDGCPNDVLEFGTVDLGNGNQTFVQNIANIVSGRMDANPLTGELWIMDPFDNEIFTLTTNGIANSIGESFPSTLFNGVVRNIEFAPYLTNGIYGGILEGEIQSFCVDDGMDDFIGAGQITLFGNTGTENQWVVTDDQGNILGLPDNYSEVNFEGAEAGTCLVWNLSYEGIVMNLEVGQNASELQGCFALSNPVQVVRETGCGIVNCPDQEEMRMWGIIGLDLLMIDINTGKLLKTIPLITNFSADFAGLTWDEEQDIFYVVAERGTNPILATIDRYTGVVTEIGEIDQVQPQAMDLTLVESLEYNPDNGILFASGGNNPANDNFASSFLFQLDKTNGNAIRLGSFGNSCQQEADNITYANSTWYYLDGCPEPFEFGTLNLGNADQNFIRNITEFSGGKMDAHPTIEQLFIADALTRTLYSLETNGNPTYIGEIYPPGVFNAILRDIDFAPYVDNGYYGGILSSDPIVFCVDDGADDFIPLGDIQLFGNNGNENQWIVTDTQGNILGLPGIYSDVNFEGVEPGTCLIWHLSYAGPIENLEDGQNVFELEGCFGLSNPIQVLRESGTDCGNLAADDTGLRIFPNPSSEFITLQSDFMDTDLATIEIYDSRGSLVKKMSQVPMNDQRPLNVSQLSSGVYTLHMIQGRSIQSKRFVIAR